MEVEVFLGLLAAALLAGTVIAVLVSSERLWSIRATIAPPVVVAHIVATSMILWMLGGSAGSAIAVGVVTGVGEAIGLLAASPMVNARFAERRDR